MKGLALLSILTFLSVCTMFSLTSMMGLELIQRGVTLCESCARPVLSSAVIPAALSTAVSPSQLARPAAAKRVPCGGELCKLDCGRTRPPDKGLIWYPGHHRRHRDTFFDRLARREVDRLQTVWTKQREDTRLETNVVSGQELDYYND